MHWNFSAHVSFSIKQESVSAKACIKPQRIKREADEHHKSENSAENKANGKGGEEFSLSFNIKQKFFIYI